MAGPFRGRSGTAGHDSDRNSNERNAASYLSAIRVHFWPVLRDHDLRRQFRERLEPAEGPGKAYAGHSAARTPASNRLGLEPGWTDLLVHAEKYQPSLRLDGVEVHRRQDAPQGVQVRSQIGRAH